jgi:hypothetical protein
MRIWCIKIGIVLVLQFNPWVEASADGLQVPEGLYSPVAKNFGTCLKIRMIVKCETKSKRNETNRNETKPIETKGNQSKRNETKIETKLQNQIKWIFHTFVLNIFELNNPTLSSHC